MNDNPTVAIIVFATLLGYTAGSLPTAYLLSRLKGVNIFEVGSRQAGATNVFREVSHTMGAAVFLIDAVKGLLAVLAARWLGMEGGLLLLPAFAVILGHWNSPMTRFKGGDGVSSLSGIGLGLAPQAVALPYILTAIVAVAWNSKLAHPTLWAAIIGYVTFLALAISPIATVDPAVVIGMTVMGVSIMLHSVAFHRRSRSRMHPEGSPVDTDVENPPVQQTNC
ncbi:MAG: glycerol-3-phosphate acyltransferase [Dehalococcoidia bacterium]